MFKPFHDLNYGDRWFVKRHLKRLIPSDRLLEAFIEETDFNSLKCEYLFKAAASLINHGLPVFPNHLLYESLPGAIVHLDYLLMGQTVLTYQSEMDLDEDEFKSWFAVIIAYLLSVWFDEGTAVNIVTYSPYNFKPQAVLHIDKTQQRFESGQMKPIYQRFIDTYRINHCDTLLLAEKFKLYGITHYIHALEPYGFLHYSSVLDLLMRYRLRGDTAAVAMLIGVYIPKEFIERALRL